MSDTAVPNGLAIVEAVALSDRGQVRRANEDSQVVAPPLYAVADGMGGARGGEVASSIAVTTLRELVVGADGAPADVIRGAIETANRRIHERAQADPSVGGMGTTTTAVVAHPGGPLVFGHVGDSRAYRLRAGQLQQLSDDHSLVGELVRRGALTPAEAERHPQRSIITRALGADAAVAVDVWTDEPRDGDVYLLCSDGLSSMIDDELIHEILVGADQLVDAARELVHAANAAGGDDNVTVVLLRVGSAADAPRTEVLGADASLRAAPSGIGATRPGRRQRRRRGFLGRLVIALVAVLVVAGVGIGGVAALRSAHFVGAVGDTVTVFQGLPYELPGEIRLYREVAAYPALPVATLDQPTRVALFDHAILGEGEARRRVERLIAERAAWDASLAAVAAEIGTGEAPAPTAPASGSTGDAVPPTTGAPAASTGAASTGA